MIDGVVLDASDINPGTIITRTLEPGGNPELPEDWKTSVSKLGATSTPEQPTFELDIDGFEIGSIFGASIGQAIGGKNVFARVGAGTVLSAVLGNVGQTLDLYFSDTSPDASFTDAVGKAFDNFDADLGKAFQGQAVGAVSGFLVGELAEAIGLDDKSFGAGLFKAATGSLTSKVLNNAIAIANTAPGDTPISIFAGIDTINGLVSSVSGAVGGYLGGYLANQIVAPENVAGSIGSSIGGALGSSIGAGVAFGLPTVIGSISAGFSLASAVAAAPLLAIPVVGVFVFIGTLIGTLLGNFIGDSFSGWWDDHGYGDAYTSVRTGGGQFLDGAVVGNDQDFIEPAKAVRDAITTTLNAFLSITGSQNAGGEELEVQVRHRKYQSGTFGEITKNDYFIEITSRSPLGGEEQLYLAWGIEGWSPQKWVDTAVIQSLKRMDLAGGNIYMQRAIERSAATTAEGLFGDLQIAADYARYLDNKDIVDALIALDPGSAFAAGWIITLLRAEELGVNRMAESDFRFGMAGFLPWFNPARFGSSIADTRFAVDGTTLSLTFDRDDGRAPRTVNIQNFQDLTHFNVVTGANATGSTGNDLWIAAAGAAAVFTDATENVLDVSSHDTLVGAELGDTINAGIGHDLVYGREGNDVINAGSGHDTLIGGLGNDTIQGGLGDDTFLYGRGDGVDTLSDSGTAPQRVHEHVEQVQVGTTTEQVWVEGHYESGGGETPTWIPGHYETVTTPVYETQTLFDPITEMVPVEVAYQFQTGSHNESRLVQAHTVAQQVWVEGGEGYSGYWTTQNVVEPILDAQGQFILADASWTGLTLTRDVSIPDFEERFKTEYQPLVVGAAQDAGLDTLRFEAGINPDDVIFELDGNDLVIGIRPEGWQDLTTPPTMAELTDKVRLTNWLVENNRIEYVAFANGEALDVMDILRMIDPAGTALTTMDGIAVGRINGTAAAETLTSGVASEFINAGAGNDLIRGAIARDVIDGGDGVDTLDYGLAIIPSDSRGIRGSLASGTVIKPRGQYDTLFSIENLFGTNRDDTLAGDDGNNELRGGDGDDELYGSGGNDLLLGGNGADTLSGDDGTDTLNGEAGDDILYGGAGNDTLNGGAGADTLLASEGTDTYNGGTEIDTISFANWDSNVAIDLNLTTAQAVTGGAVTLISIENVTGGSGNDTLSGSNTVASTVVGGAGNDTLFGGNAGNDTLDGGDGDDILRAWSGTDEFKGGDGIDTLTFTGWSSAVSVNLASTTAQAVTGGSVKLSGIENLTGGNGSDTLTGDAKANVLNGGAGNDTLSGVDGDDTFIVSAGVDYYVGGNGFDTITFAAFTTGVVLNLALTTAQVVTGGSVRVSTIEGVIGGSGNDTLTGDGLANRLDGGAGNDTINGGVGDDTLVASIGTDTYVGGTGIDTIDFSAWTTNVTLSLAVTTAQAVTGGTAAISGVENIVGGQGNDTLTGDGLANKLNGGAGNDTLTGGAGIDTLIASTGTDTYNGGTEVDTLTFADWASGVTIDLNLTTAQTVAGGSVTLAAIENLIGGKGDDILTGSNTVASVISGGAGDDTLFGGNAGNDTLNGDDGDDTLRAWSGVDVFNGGAGNDTLSFTGWTSGVSINLALTTAQTVAGGSVTLTGIENIAGGNGNDTLTGDAQANILSGGAGNDTVNGGAGADTLIASVGTDTYVGGTERDTISFATWDSAVTINLNLTTAQVVTGGTAAISGVESVVGGAGNDTLTGDGQNNDLTGGAGNDTLVGGSGNDVLDGGAGNDTMSGGVGADTYRFGFGDGQDLVDNADASTSTTDRLEFDAEVDVEDIWFSRTGDDLLVGLLDGPDRMTFTNWYGDNAAKVDEFTLRNGQKLLATNVDSLVNAMASFVPNTGVGSTGVTSSTVPPSVQIAASSVWSAPSAPVGGG